MTVSFDPKENLVGSNVKVPPDPAASGGALDVEVGDGGVFPDPSVDGAYNLVVSPDGQRPTRLNSEIIRVFERTGDTLGGLQRGQEGTTPRPIQPGDRVELAVTRKTIKDVEDAINEIVLGTVGDLESVYLTNYNSGILSDPNTFHDAATDAMTRQKRLVLPPGVITVDAFDPIYGGLVVESPSRASVLKPPAGSVNPIISHAGTGAQISKVIFSGVTFRGNGYDAYSTVVSAVYDSGTGKTAVTVEPGDGAGFPTSGKLKFFDPSYGTASPPYQSSTSPPNPNITGRVGDVLTVTGNYGATGYNVAGWRTALPGKKTAVSLTYVDKVGLLHCEFENLMNAAAQLVECSHYLIDDFAVRNSTTRESLNAIHIAHLPDSSDDPDPHYGLSTTGFVGNGHIEDCEQAGVVFTAGGGKAGFPPDELIQTRAVVHKVNVKNLGNWTSFFVEAGALKDEIIFVDCHANRIGWGSGGGVAFGAGKNGIPPDLVPAGAQVVAPGAQVLIDIAAHNARGYLRAGTLVVTRAADGSRILVPYSIHDDSHFTIPAGFSFLADDTLQGWDSFVRRVKVIDCTADCEDAVGMDALHMNGDDCLASGGVFRFSNSGARLGNSNNGRKSLNTQLKNLDLVMVDNDATRAPQYVNASDQDGLQIHGVTTRREGAGPASTVANDGVVLVRCDNFSVALVDLDQAGSHGYHLNECQHGRFALGSVVDWGANGGVSSSAFYFERGCYDVAVKVATSRNTGFGVAGDHIAYVPVGGGQKIRFVVSDDLEGALAAGYVDEQDGNVANRTVNGLQTIAAGGTLLMNGTLGVSSPVPAHGGSFHRATTGALHTYASADHGRIRGVTPGGTFANGETFYFDVASLEFLPAAATGASAPSLLLMGA